MTLRTLAWWFLTGFLLAKLRKWFSPTIRQRSRSMVTTPRKSASTPRSRSSSRSSSTICLRRTPCHRRKALASVVGTPGRSSRTRRTSMPTSRHTAAASPRVKCVDHWQERGGPRNDPCGHFQRGKPSGGSTVTSRSPPSSPTPARRQTPRRPTWCARPSRSTGSPVRSTRQETACPRCSWSSPPTGSPSKTRHTSRRSARTCSVLITPVVEVDGRDRMLDIYHYRKANWASRCRDWCTGKVRRPRQQPT